MIHLPRALTTEESPGYAFRVQAVASWLRILSPQLALPSTRLDNITIQPRETDNPAILAPQAQKRQRIQAPAGENAFSGRYNHAEGPVSSRRYAEAGEIPRAGDLADARRPAPEFHGVPRERVVPATAISGTNPARRLPDSRPRQRRRGQQRRCSRHAQPARYDISIPSRTPVAAPDFRITNSQ